MKPPNSFPQKQTPQPSDADPSEVSNEQYVSTRMTSLAIIALVIIVLGMTGSGLAAWGGVIATTVGVSAASGLLGLTSGGLLGFLFGLPKTLSNQTSSATMPGTGAGMASPPTTTTAAANSRLLRTNTNLEEISDWLTKIIVGLGLTQLHTVNDHLLAYEETIHRLAPKGAAALPMLATIMLCTSGILGFILMYLEARTVLTRIFNWYENVVEKNLLIKALSDISSSGTVSPSALAPAADALKNVWSLTPGNADLREVTAKALSVAGRPTEARAVLSTAPTSTVRNQISMMFTKLYTTGGYVDAIAMSNDLMNTEAKNRADFWFYRAAAFGQQYSALSKQADRPSADQLSQISKLAAAAAQHAIALDQHYRPRLLALAQPKPGDLDDDLSDLWRDDPTFRDALTT